MSSRGVAFLFPESRADSEQVPVQPAVDIEATLQELGIVTVPIEMRLGVIGDDAVREIVAMVQKALRGEEQGVNAGVVEVEQVDGSLNLVIDDGDIARRRSEDDLPCEKREAIDTSIHVGEQLDQEQDSQITPLEAPSIPAPTQHVTTEVQGSENVVGGDTIDPTGPLLPEAPPSPSPDSAKDPTIQPSPQNVSVHVNIDASATTTRSPRPAQRRRSKSRPKRHETPTPRSGTTLRTRARLAGWTAERTQTRTEPRKKIQYSVVRDWDGKLGRYIVRRQVEGRSDARRGACEGRVAVSADNKGRMDGRRSGRLMSWLMAVLS